MSLKIAGHPVNQSQKIIVTRDENDTLEFVSSVEYAGPRGISIALPLRNQIPMELRRGEELYLKVPTSSFIIEFKSRIRSFTADNIILVNLGHPKDFKRVQRRKSFRMKTLLNIEIAPPPEDKDKDPLFSRTTALDISAGGMEVMATARYEKGTILLARFTLEMDKKTLHSFCVEAVVRRVIPVTAGKFKLGLEFQNMSKADTDRIYRYIFKKSAEKGFWDK